MHQERPMRILHLVGDHEDAGGVLSVIRNLQGVSSKNQLEHVVWVKQGYQEKRTPSLTYRHASSVIAESVNHWKLLAMAWPAYRELRALLEEEAFDVIHAHSRGTLLIGILVAKRMQRRVLFTNHNYAQRTGLYRWASRQHRMHTVLLTPNMAKHYRLDCSASKTSIISACYDASLLERPVKQPGRPSADQPIQLVGVGNIIGWKKWDLILEALIRLEPHQRACLQFHIWGPIPDLPEAQVFASQLKAKLQDPSIGACFKLHGPTREVEAKIRSADWFILPSTNEPCSVALMEALALGCPALVSASGGNIDIVKPGCGRTFTPDDPNSLAEALKALIKNPVPGASPEAIRQSVCHRSATVVLDQYLELYQQLK